MSDYLILNIIFIGTIFYFFKLNPWLVKRRFLQLLSLLVLTALFDNLIIGIGMVGYDPTKILGIKIGLAPIEDFGYTIMGVYLIPELWSIFNSRELGNEN